MADARPDDLPDDLPDDPADDRPDDLLVVYGTLRSGTGWRERLGVADRVEPVGPCTLAGSLVELGWYPGLVLDGVGPVVAEVLRLLDPTALAAFDRFEGYDPGRPDAGEYRRRAIEVTVGGSRLTAWVYELRVAPLGKAPIPGGDWLAHLDAGSGTHGPTSGCR